MSVRIQELAVPKGIAVPLCDLCGKKSTTKCETCRVTFYCSQEHKLIDMKAFHPSVCEIMKEIKSEKPVPFSEADRTEEKRIFTQKKKDACLLAKSTARKWLLERNPSFAYPSALISWNMAREIWSPNGVEVVYPMCLVAEVFLGLGNLKAAEDYMTVACWTSQKHDIVSPIILSQLYRLKGLVYMTAKNWQQAKGAFAEFVYATATEYGTPDIRIAIPYGCLGLSLLELDDIDGAMALFHKAADKWMEYLLAQYENNTMRCATQTEMIPGSTVEDLEFQFLEIKIVFKWIYERIRRLPMDSVSDLIFFKILCIQALSEIRSGEAKDSVVFKEEAIAVAERTKMDKAASKLRIELLKTVLDDDFILRWERKHNRPRTVATKYLEMIKAINV